MISFKTGAFIFGVCSVGFIGYMLIVIEGRLIQGLKKLDAALGGLRALEAKIKNAG